MADAKLFLDRLPPAATIEQRGAIEQAFFIAGNFAAKRRKIDEDTRLSAAGKADAIRELIAKDHGPQFKKLADFLERNRVAAATARANLRPVPLNDPGKKELRDFLRGLPAAERMRMILEKESLRVAAMDAESFLSGLTDGEHEQVIGHHIQQKSPKELARLDELDEANVCVDAALQVTQAGMLRSASPIVAPVQERAAQAIAARA
jgi:hypothetical protein